MSVPTTVATPQTAQAGEQTGVGAGGATAAQTESGQVQFTPEQQAHIDRVIADRLARQKATIDGQTKAEREKAEREAAEQKAKEQGQWQSFAEKEKSRADAAEQKAAETERATRERLIRTEVKATATALGFADPADAYRFVDFAAVTFDANGDPENVEQLLADLIDPQKGKKTYLVAGERQNGAGLPIPRTPAGTTLTRDQFNEQERIRLVRSGKYSGL